MSNETAAEDAAMKDHLNRDRPTEKKSAADFMEASKTIYFKGTDVPFTADATAGFRVFPVSLADLEEFTTGVKDGVLRVLKAVRVNKVTGQIVEGSMLDGGAEALKALVQDLAGLVDRCIVGYDGEQTIKGVSIKPMPLGFTALVTAAWIDLSLSKENINPMVVALERTVESLTGKKLSISETLSKLSSPPATASVTSSTVTDQAGPTTVGQPLTSTSGSGDQDASSPSQQA